MTTARDSPGRDSPGIINRCKIRLIRAFQFFEAIRGQDNAVWEFDYYANRNQGQPTPAADSLAMFYAEKLQAYLKL